MSGLAGAAVFGVGMVLALFTTNMILGWNLDGACPMVAVNEFVKKPAPICNSIYWTYIVDYMPAWLFIAQILVVLALASPFALVRAKR